MCERMENLKALDLRDFDDEIQVAKALCLVGRCFSTKSVSVDAMMKLLVKICYYMCNLIHGS